MRLEYSKRSSRKSDETLILMLPRVLFQIVPYAGEASHHSILIHLSMKTYGARLFHILLVYWRSVFSHSVKFTNRQPLGRLLTSGSRR